MRLLVDIAIALIVALVLGLGSAWYTVDRGDVFGSVTIGPWTASPNAGRADADPYSSASIARTGEVPLGAGEGVAFTAQADSSGLALTGSCGYVLSGQTPSARLWTLTLTDATGRLTVTTLERTGFHSREIIRRPDGSFEIALSADVQPGNWLQLTPAAPFHLVLRLYDAPLASGAGLSGTTMPQIVRRACR